MIQDGGQPASKLQSPSHRHRGLLDRSRSIRAPQDLRGPQNAPQRVADRVSQGPSGRVLFSGKTREVEPAGLRVVVSEHPLEVSRRRLAIAKYAAVVSELGEPARGVCMIACGNSGVYMIAPRPVGVLNRDEPVRCSMSGGQCRDVSRRRVPRKEAAQDLRSVEYGGPTCVLVNLACGKRAVGELQAEEELDASRGPADSARKRLRRVRHLELSPANERPPANGHGL